MSELRHDALSGQDVIVATARAARPVTFAPPPSDDRPGASCPFGPDREHMTPPETARTGSGAPGAAGWRVRVFPNLYPIVGGSDAGPGATGAHEVVVLSPDHDRSFAQLDDDEAIEVMMVMRDRVRAHLGTGHAYATAIVNHLRPAGASISHPHAQVIALDFVPPAVRGALDRFRDADDDLVLTDYAKGSVISEEPVTAWCPFASPSPFLVRIAHPDAGAEFGFAPDDLVASVALGLRDALARLARTLHDPPYNVVVHTAPPGDTHFHWFVEIMPRVSVVAGFEFATGVMVNTVAPDDAASRLRESSG